MDNNAINTTNSIDNGIVNTTTTTTVTTDNSNWVWSDEKLSYYDQSTGWYYREDLGYFYFDENNECHYVYPAETSAVNAATEVEGEQYHSHHHKKHKHKHKEKKEEEEEEGKEEEEKDKQEGKDHDTEKEKNNSDSDSSEWEEGEISEDDEDDKNAMQTTSTLQQSQIYMNGSAYYNNTYYSNMSGVGMVNSTSSTFPTEIQLAYGMDPTQGSVVNANGVTELQQQQAYEDEYMRLVVKYSGLYDKGSIILIDTEGLSIGRDKSYEKRLRLPEMQVSKYHAKIYLDAVYQQVIPTQTEAQPSSYDTTAATLNYPAEQPPLYLKKNGQKAKTHPKRKYEDLDHDYSDKEEEINYSYNMYEDEDDKSNYHPKNKNNNDNKKKEEEDSSKIQSKKIKTTDTIKEEKNSMEDKHDKSNTEKNEKENDLSEKKDVTMDNLSNDSKNEKNTQEKSNPSHENDQKEKDNETNELVSTKEPRDNKDNKDEKEKEKEKEKEEGEEEEEEEGEITDDGEYIPIEEDEKEKEEKNEDQRKDHDDGYGYQENYDQAMAMNINYEPPPPQYTCTYHFSIIDMGSTHGTYVNGERLSESKICSKPCPLNNGDTIQIGSTLLEVHYHKPWGACKDCTITEHQKEIPLLDKSRMTQGTEGTGYDPHPVSLEEQRKNELKRLKSKYLKRPAHTKKSKSSGYYGPGGDDEGGEGDGTSSNPYIDRAAQRRELYSTNIPYFK